MLSRAASIAAGLSISAAAAQAADLAPSSPSPGIQRSAYNWTGFYVGANVGGNITSNYNADTQPATTFRYRDDNTGQIAATLRTGSGGVAGGLQAGYNWQWGAFVAGGEADIEGLEASGSQAVVTSGTVLGSTTTTSASERLNWLSTVRGRVGYVLWDRWMVFGTGGLAVGNIQNSGGVTINDLPNYQWHASDNTTKVGYALGGGVEWAFTDRITLRLEGIYYNLSSQALTAYGNAAVQANPALAGYSYAFKTTTAGDILRVGADYKF